MKFFITLFILSFAFYTASGQAIIRWNQAGYTPKSKKTAIVMSNRSMTGASWEIINSENTTVLEGELATKVAGLNDYLPKAANYEIDFSDISLPGSYNLVLGMDTASILIAEKPYELFARDILHYFRVLRSGSPEALYHKKSHMGDASCPIYQRKDFSNSDWIAKGGEKIDMTGGWYDAGDYIKFTLTTAYATYLMLRAYETNPEIFNYKTYSTSELNDLLDEAKWGLDYLVKCSKNAQNGTFVIQVGDETDHREGLRLPENDLLDGQRKAYSALSPTQMGYVSAALLLGSKIFSSVENYEEEAKSYLRYGQELRLLAEKSSGIPPAWYKKGWETFYKDESVADNLGLAAIEEHIAGQTKESLGKAKSHAEEANAGYWVSWGTANMLLHNRMAPYYSQSRIYLETDLNDFQKKANAVGNLWGTPHDYTWATLYSFLGVANSAAEYERNFGDQRYRDMVIDVRDYFFGKNNWGVSFIASERLPNTVQHIYSPYTKLQPNLFPTGAVSEGPGDRKTHDELDQYFNIPENDPYHEFNTPLFVFFDNDSDFQCMETTISGLGDALLFIALISSME